MLQKLKRHWFLLPELPEHRNYFGFQHPNELALALADPHLIYENAAGAPLPEALFRHHHSTQFPHDAPYVVAWTRFHDDQEFFRQAQSYQGQLIINDTLDQLYPVYPLYDLARERNWVYIKHQQIKPQFAHEYLRFRAFPVSFAWYRHFQTHPYARLQAGAYNPTKSVVQAFSHAQTAPEQDRPIDLLFIGSLYRGRRQKVERFQEVARRLNLKCECVVGGLTPQQYVEKMSQAKIVLSFVGWAPRCRREWEIPLSGALMLNDADLKRQAGGNLPLLNANEHFVWEAEDRLLQVKELIENEAKRLQIAQQGQNLAIECFVKSPSIEWRLIHRWLENPDFHWDGEIINLQKEQNKHEISLTD